MLFDPEPYCNNWHFPWEPPLWSDTGCCKKNTSTGRRSVELRWTFAAIARWHWQRRSRYMPSTMKRSAWPFLSQCRTCNQRKISTGWLSEACLKSSAAPFWLLAYIIAIGRDMGVDQKINLEPIADFIDILLTIELIWFELLDLDLCCSDPSFLSAITIEHGFQTDPNIT